MNLHETSFEVLPELGAHEFPELGGAHEFPEMAGAYEFPELGGGYEFPEGECELLGECEGQGEEQFLGGLAGLAANAARSVLGGLMGGDGEFPELDRELNPARRYYPDAVLEHLAHEAAQAETEDQAAEAFLPLIPMLAAKLLPLAAKAAPMVAKAMPKVMSVFNKVGPHLTRGLGNAARTLFRNRAGRPLLRTLPGIAQRTVGRIARQVAQGGNVTPQSAVRTLAQQTRSYLSQPQRCRSAVRRSRQLDAQAHRLVRPAGGGCGCRCAHCGR
jgi:hypothetical protein